MVVISSEKSRRMLKARQVMPMATLKGVKLYSNTEMALHTGAELLFFLSI